MTKKSDSAVFERDAAKRRVMYQDIQADFRKTSPFIVVHQITEVAAFRSNLDELKLGPTSDATYMYKVNKR
jgi:peptide/nickel transport system substrate-binding protein